VVLLLLLYDNMNKAQKCFLSL